MNFCEILPHITTGKKAIGVLFDDDTYLTVINNKLALVNEITNKIDYNINIVTLNIESFDLYEPFKTIKDTDFNIGDKIKVINYEHTYSTYRRAFINYNFKNTKFNICENNDDGYIIDIINHDTLTNRTLIVVESSDRQFIIEKKGIKKI